jgi:hypothetical protein
MFRERADAGCNTLTGSVTGVLGFHGQTASGGGGFSASGWNISDPIVPGFEWNRLEKADAWAFLKWTDSCSLAR